ncbi:MAG: hypothetical protein HYV68_02135 [Candidatus Taylorbacteria bacterium]|nr:hypothetical protein [Candidatus Taylorbacteria bacterium]
MSQEKFESRGVQAEAMQLREKIVELFDRLKDSPPDYKIADELVRHMTGEVDDYLSELVKNLREARKRRSAIK